MNFSERTEVLDGDKKNGIIGIYIDDVLRKKIPYKNRKIHGIVEIYDEDGLCIEKIEYFCGRKNGISRKYDKKNRLISETSYENGKLNGRTTTYYESGQVESITDYKKGKENGELKIYDRRGNLMHNTIYEDRYISSTNYRTYDRHEMLDEYDDLYL